MKPSGKRGCKGQILGGAKLMKCLSSTPIPRESNKECNDMMIYRVCYTSSFYARFFYGISLSLYILLYS